MLMNHADSVCLQQVTEIASDIGRIQSAIADMSAHLSAVLYDDGLSQSFQEFARHSSRGVNVGAILFWFQAGPQHPTDPAARFDDDS